MKRQPGALPLLQFALKELWEKRDVRKLRLDTYETLGGIEGTLEHRANEIFRNFNHEEQDVCRRIFLRLVQPGEGTEDTKRRVAYHELLPNDPARAEAVRRVIQRLADPEARLITAAGRERSPQEGNGHDEDSYVEVAHEALIRGWKQLCQWIDADRAGLRTHLRLTEAAQEWAAADPEKKNDYLYTGARLAVACEWADSRGADLSKIEMAFLTASQKAERQREQDEVDHERQLREAAEAKQEAERKRAEEAEGRERDQAEAARKEGEAARRLRHRLWILIGATAAAITALLTASYFWYLALSRLADSYADAAQLASQRGAWRAALANIDEAIKLHHRDPIGLRLGKVRAWEALDENRNAFHELEDLAHRPDLGKHEGEVLLWRANFGHSRDINVEAKERLLQQALAKGLREADQFYARGLLATTSTEAIDQFRRALEVDAFHNRATIRLAMMLSLLGRRQDARDVLAKAELIFPDDPEPRIIHAIVLASEGDLAGAEKLLDWARDHAHASEEFLTSWRSGVRFLARFHDFDTLLMDQQPGFVSNAGLFRAFATFLSEFFQVMSTFRKNIDPDRMSLIDFPPFLTRLYGRLEPTLLRMLIFNRGAPRGEIDEAFRIFPTGIFPFIRGSLLLKEGKYEDAEEALLLAAEMPSLVNHRRLARFGAILAQDELLGQKTPPAALRDRVRRNIQAMMVLGDADPMRAGIMAGLAVRIGEVDLARSILAEWERRSPRDPEAWAWRAAIERIGGSYGRAMTAAQERSGRSRATRSPEAHSTVRWNGSASKPGPSSRRRQMPRHPRLATSSTWPARMLSAPRDPSARRSPPPPPSGPIERPTPTGQWRP